MVVADGISALSVGGVPAYRAGGPGCCCYLWPFSFSRFPPCGLARLCGVLSRAGPGPVVLQAEPDVVVDGVSYQAPDLTREASIYRESLLHMGTVIASIPTPTPTIVAVAEADRIAGTPVVAVLLDNPEGVSIERGGGHLDWFSPDSGLDFFRERGGDWTAPEVREASPFRTLVEYSGISQMVSAILPMGQWCMSWLSSWLSGWLRCARRSGRRLRP